MERALTQSPVTVRIWALRRHSRICSVGRDAWWLASDGGAVRVGLAMPTELMLPQSRGKREDK